MLIKQIIYRVMPAIIALAFTSCIKDHLSLDPAQSNNVVEFANTGTIASAAGAIHPRFAVDLGNLGLNDSTTFNINLSYSGAEAAPQDITVSLAIDEDALAAFNADQGAHYTTPPASIFRLPATGVIKAGERRVQLKVTIIRTNDFNFDVAYALPLKISSVSTGVVSGNFGIALYSFAARNIYDGVYEMTGSLVDNTTASIVFYPGEVDLITQSRNAVAMYDHNVASGYGHPIQSGSSGSYYGTYSPMFAVADNGTVTSVTNYFGQLAGTLKRSAELDPTGVNKVTFDQEGKVVSIEVSYTMTQNGVLRTTFKEKLTYKRPR